MKKIGIVAALAFITSAGILSIGCGSGGSGASCDLKTTASHICTTYDYGALDTTGALASAEATACTNAKGTPGDCPTASSVGTCTITSAGVSSAVTYYSDVGGVTADAAKTACTASGGTFK
jgi:hypothetical protein